MAGMGASFAMADIQMLLETRRQARHLMRSETNSRFGKLIERRPYYQMAVVRVCPWKPDKAFGAALQRFMPELTAVKHIPSA